MTNEPKSFTDLRIALGKQNLRANKAEQQVRSLSLEVEKLRKELNLRNSEGMI